MTVLFSICKFCEGALYAVSTFFSPCLIAAVVLFCFFLLLFSMPLCNQPIGLQLALKFYLHYVIGYSRRSLNPIRSYVVLLMPDDKEGNSVPINGSALKPNDKPIATKRSIMVC